MGRTFDSTSSTDERPVPVATVAGAHGLRGLLRLRVDGDSFESLRSARVLWLEGRGGMPARRYQVASASPGRAGELRVALVGVEGREAAEALRGRRVSLAPSQLEPLEEGEFWEHELLGARVEGQDGAPLGTVREIWRTGAPDLLVVAGEGGRQHLIPAALVRRVEAGRVVVELLPGLLEDGAGAAADEDAD